MNHNTKLVIVLMLFLTVLADSPSLLAEKPSGAWPEQHHFYMPSMTGQFVRAALAGFPPDQGIWSISFAGSVMTFHAQGEIRAYPPGEESRLLNIGLEKHVMIERVLFFYSNDALYLVLGLSDGEMGWGQIIRIDERSFVVLSKQHIPAFNIGPAILTADSIYVAAIGYIAKIDRGNLEVKWCHRGLYRQYKINNFNDLLVKDNTVIGTDNFNTTLRADVETGIIDMVRGERLAHALKPNGC